MNDTSELWHPDRLATVGWIMDRYSEHLQPNDRIRIGQEGDPCSSYRSASEAPCARVDNIHKDPDGTVRFRAVFEESGEAVEFDNRNISPNRIWEIHPEFVEEYRGRVERAAHEQHFDEPPSGEFKEIQTRIVEMEYRGTAMEKTIGGAIRELAGDLMRVHNGNPPNFSIRFAGDYDDTMKNFPYQGSRRDKDHRHEFAAAEEVPDNDVPMDRHVFDDFSGVGYTGEVQAVHVGSNDDE